MKSSRNIILPLCAALVLLSSCAEETNNNKANIIPPVISEGLADNAILHDSPKIGKVSFKPAGHITGNVFNWSIDGIQIANNTMREITADFTSSGTYLVTLNVDGIEDKGNIIIPETQSYEIDMGDNHTIISDIGQKRLFIYSKRK